MAPKTQGRTSKTPAVTATASKTPASKQQYLSTQRYTDSEDDDASSVAESMHGEPFENRKPSRRAYTGRMDPVEPRYAVSVSEASNDESTELSDAESEDTVVEIVKPIRPRKVRRVVVRDPRTPRRSYLRYLVLGLLAVLAINIARSVSVMDCDVPYAEQVVAACRAEALRLNRTDLTDLPTAIGELGDKLDDIRRQKMQLKLLRYKLTNLRLTAKEIAQRIGPTDLKDKEQLIAALTKYSALINELHEGISKKLRLSVVHGVADTTLHSLVYWLERDGENHWTLESRIYRLLHGQSSLTVRHRIRDQYLDYIESIEPLTKDAYEDAMWIGEKMNSMAELHKSFSNDLQRNARDLYESESSVKGIHPRKVANTKKILDMSVVLGGLQLQLAHEMQVLTEVTPQLRAALHDLNSMREAISSGRAKLTTDFERQHDVLSKRSSKMHELKLESDKAEFRLDEAVGKAVRERSRELQNGYDSGRQQLDGIIDVILPEFLVVEP